MFLNIKLIVDFFINRKITILINYKIEISRSRRALYKLQWTLPYFKPKLIIYFYLHKNIYFYQCLAEWLTEFIKNVIL